MNFKKISILIMTATVILGGTHCMAKEPLMRDFGTKVETDKNKIWRVEFNEDVDHDSINDDNISVVDEYDNSKLNLKFTKENNLKIVAIQAPSGGYKSGHTYRLEVKQGIKSIKKHILNKHIKFKFKISDLNNQTVKKQPEKVIINEKKEITSTPTESSMDSLKIISKIVQPGIVGRGITYQTGFLDFEMKESTIQNDHDLNILGKIIKLKKGDTSDKVKFKILDVFKDDENWKFEIGKVVIKEKWASVQYTSLKAISNVNKLATDTEEIKFKQIDEDVSDLGAVEKKEICEVTVVGQVEENKEMQLEIKDANHNVHLSTIKVNVNKNDDSKIVSEKIYNALKQDTRQMSRMYNITLDKNNSKVILTQKISYDANTTVTFKLDNVAEQTKPKTDSIKVQSQPENKLPKEVIKPEVELKNTKKEPEHIEELSKKTVADKLKIENSINVNKGEKTKESNITDVKKETVEPKVEVKKPVEKPKTDVMKKEIVSKSDIKNSIENPKESLNISSRVVQKAVKGRRVTYQTGFLDFEMKEKTIQNDHDLNILGKIIKLKKGDTSDKVKFKILDVFKDDADWEFEIGKVVIKEKWASVQYTSLKAISNVNKLATDTEEIKFKQIDEDVSDLGAVEKKEICEVTVVGQVEENKEMQLEIKDANHNVHLSTIKVNVNKNDDSKIVSEKIYNALKQDTRQMSRMYNITLDKNNSKVILTQKISYDANTTVTTKSN